MDQSYQVSVIRTDVALADGKHTCSSRDGADPLKCQISRLHNMFQLTHLQHVYVLMSPGGRYQSKTTMGRRESTQSIQIRTSVNLKSN